MEFPDSMKGRIAKRYWNDCTFTYGIEYGVLIALRRIFNIDSEDLRRNEMEIDYKKLLTKYINYIQDIEGEDYIGVLSRFFQSKQKFSNKEREELKKISNECLAVESFL